LTLERLSPRQRAAVDRLVPPDQQTGGLREILIAAAREAWRRRHQNTLDGGIVLDLLLRGIPGVLAKASLRVIQYLTSGVNGPDDQGIPPTTIRRWSQEPGKADTPPDPTPELGPAE
jgi:hypothetical protein